MSAIFEDFVIGAMWGVGLGVLVLSLWFLHLFIV